jgi:hypothetical protein
MTEKQAAKGWYADSEQPGQQRYWSGRAWTSRRRNDPNLSGEQKKAMEEAAAFDSSPVGQAIAARKEGAGFFEVQLVVEVRRGRVSWTGNVDRKATGTHTGTLAEIEAAGWKLEHVGYIFQITGEQTRNQLLTSGQQVAVSGQTVGIYLFRAA